MKSTKIIITLIVVAVLAIAVYYGLNKEQQQPISENIQPISEGAALTLDQKAALDFPNENSSPGEIKKHFEVVSKIAESADVLDVTNCVLKPLVLQVKVDDNIKVFNGGQSAAVLELGTLRYSVPAGETLTIKASFPPGGGGLYGYACNSNSTPGGLSGTGTGIFMLIAE